MARPTSRGRRKLSPESGTRPILTKAVVKLAPTAARRRSPHRARLIPAPAATPFTATTRGFSKPLKASTTRL